MLTVILRSWKPGGSLQPNPSSLKGLLTIRGRKRIIIGEAVNNARAVPTNDDPRRKHCDDLSRSSQLAK